MHGIVIGIDPVAFALGPVAVRWYGITVVAAILVGFALVLSEARRRGLDEDEVANLGLWAVLAAIIGARLAHVIDHFSVYAANPAAIFALQEGGLSIYGGLIGGLLAGAFYARRARLALPSILDAAAPGLIFGQAVGRLGCIVNGDAQGAPADLPWSFTYVNPDSLAPQLGVPGHPYPLYEIIWNLIGFAILWRLRGKVRTPGTLFGLYVAYYSAGRFALSFVRQELVVMGGLQQAQIIALGGLLLSTLALAYLWRPRRVTLTTGRQQS